MPPDPTSPVPALPGLVPYVFGWPPLADALGRVPGMVSLDATAADSTAFARCLNAANTLAFDQLGMPLWVQLDCATLPSAFHGFAARFGDLDPATADALARTHVRLFGAAPEVEAGDLVPVSGFCAVRTPVPDTIVAFSLFTVLRGHGLGLRTKALGLRAHRGEVTDAMWQVGVTQYANPAVTVHAAFGPLTVVAARAHGHTQPDASFVYRLEIPAASVLADLAAGGRLRHAAPADAVRVDLDDDPASAVEALGGAGVVVVPPGRVHAAGRRHLLVCGT